MALVPGSNKEDGPWSRDSPGSSWHLEINTLWKYREKINRVKGHQDQQVSISLTCVLLLAHNPLVRNIPVVFI